MIDLVLPPFDLLLMITYIPYRITFRFWKREREEKEFERMLLNFVQFQFAQQLRYLSPIFCSGFDWIQPMSMQKSMICNRFSEKFTVDFISNSHFHTNLVFGEASTSEREWVKNERSSKSVLLKFIEQGNRSNNKSSYFCSKIGWLWIRNASQIYKET